MAVKKEKMVFKDGGKTYEISYSQSLQEQILKTNKILITLLAVLFLLLLVMFVKFSVVYNQLDTLDVLSRIQLIPVQ